MAVHETKLTPDTTGLDFFKCRYDDAFSRVSGFLNISLAASEESHNKLRGLLYRCNRCPLAESLVSIYRG